MARERGLSVPWGFEMEGGARVWGVQGGETVAGEGGALSFAHPAAVGGRRYNDPVLGQDHLQDVLPLAALPSLVQEPRLGFSNSTQEQYPACGFVISSTALGLLAPVYDNRIRSRCTGKERDTESGLDYFGARYYASNMGRFMSPDWSAKEDPVPYSSFDNPQSLNLFSYVLNNPLVKNDKDGHCAEDLCIVEGAATAYIAGAAVVAGTAAILSTPAGQRSLQTFTSAAASSFSSSFHGLTGLLVSRPNQQAINRRP
jgi:RHS repeat-associated protein